MSLIADGLLVATCLTAAIYCFVLSRRLRRLTSTEDGLGQQLLQFNAALAETRAAVKEMRGSAKSASERLAREIAQSKKVAASLERIVVEAEKLLDRRDDYDLPPREEADEPKEDTSRAEMDPPQVVEEVNAPDENTDLPDVDDLEIDESELELDDKPDVESAGEERLGFIPGQESDKSASQSDDNLLKVERMAL